MNWMFLPLKRYAQFSGRSRPLEFWMFFVLQLIIYSLLTVVAFVIGVGVAGLSSSGSGSMSNGGLVGAVAAMGVFLLVYLLVVLIFLVPNLAVSARRLHDTNKSGWWQLIYWVPVLLGNVLPIVGAGSQSTALASAGMILSLIGLLGLIVLIVFYCLPGTPGPNQYGPDPLEAERMAMGAAPGYPAQPYPPQSY